MKKVYLLFAFPLFLLLCFSNLRAQSWAWAEQGIGCENKNAEGESVAIDKLGNIYFTGYFQDTLIIGTDTLKAKNSFYCAFLVKYNSSGKVLWMKQALGTGSVYCEQFANSVAIDKSDNIYIAGQFMDTAYFGSYKLTGISRGRSNVFLVKYDSLGNVIWAKQSTSSGSGSGQGMSVAVDGQNNVEVAARFNDSITFAPYTLHGSSYCIVKYNPNGNVLWASFTNNPQAPIAFSITADAVGNTYITGTFEGTLYTGRDTLTCNTGGAFFVIKYNANGYPVWGQQSTNAQDARGYGITLDAAHNVYITGYYFGNARISKDTLTPYSNYNLFIAKYDTAGHFKWAANTIKLNNNSQWYGYALAADKYSNIYLLGGGDDNPPDIKLSNTTFSLNNAPGASLLVEYDSAGKISCGSIIGYGDDDLSGLAANPQGDYVYWGGDIEDTVTFGPDKIGPIPYGNTEWMFLAKWKTCNANTTTAVNEVKSDPDSYRDAEVKVYPNPSSGMFTIQSSVVSGKSSVEVYNVLGEKVYSHYQITNPDSYRESNYQIDLSNQPNGIYLYRVTTQEGNLIGEGKLIVQR